MALQAAGNIAKAMQHFRKAIEIDPANPEAHNYLGAAFAAQRYFREAIQEFRTAVRVKTNYPEAHFNPAQALLGEGSSDQEAGQEFRTALKLRPAYAEAHSGLGIVLAKQGDLLGAIEEFRAALKLDPNSTEARRTWDWFWRRWEIWKRRYSLNSFVQRGPRQRPGPYTVNLPAQAGPQWRIPCLHCRT